jgi:hypothetical protein
MPYVESVSELAEWIADKMGVYCEHDDQDEAYDTDHDDGNQCRIGFTIEMGDRIRQAVANDQAEKDRFEQKLRDAASLRRGRG